MYVITVIGARPQFIKASVVSREFAAQGIVEEIVHTGQHFDANMSDVFFAELEIPQPTYHLGIGGGTHGQNTGRMIEAIERVLIEKRPDWVFVYGDTDSTLAGAIAAVKLHIPVAHVEAGLRSFNRAMPEEINRVLTDHVATLLFAPTEAAVSHLATEGIDGAKVQLIGDVMYDAALFFGEKAGKCSQVLEQFDFKPQGYVLATIHRAENTDNRERLSAIIDGFRNFGGPIIWPLHPRTRNRIGLFDLTMPPNVRVIEPVGYLEMVMLEKNAALIATDSGGVQKEAFFYQVPCVTLRDETEWVELVQSKWNTLAPPHHCEIVTTAISQAMGSRGNEISPYGNGNAATAIITRLIGQVTK